MRESDAKAFFYLLKDEVAKTYLSKTTSLDTDIHNWTGKEIRNFQDDLANELNERISERWFYTHIKPVENEKLPRIDMLNILSRYAGYESWEDFRIKNSDQVQVQVETETKAKRPKNWGLLVAAFAIGITLVVALANNTATPNYGFCFYDKDTGQPIEDSTVEVTVINQGESPMHLIGDANGCVSIETEDEFIKFVVKAPYYKTDTIERKLINADHDEVIELHRDDYALMILLFATSDIQDWEKRRNQLDNMISDEAIVFQITADNTGMEMYNKTEFIDKLTTPLKSLGEIEIVETVYKDEEIINLRFIQK